MTTRVATIARDAPLSPTFKRPGPEEHPSCSSTSSTRHVRTERLRLSVSPRCNVDCSFCSLDLDRTDPRWGLGGGLQTPDQALAMLERTLQLRPTLSGVEASGPGEPLASEHALDMLAAVHARWPQLMLGLSTNGLMLPDNIDRIAELGVQLVTVTVNAVDPATQARITPKIIWQGRRLEGVAAAERLITNQLAGIARAASLGLTVKIDTVLIPTINEDGIGDVAAQVAAAGARLIEIVPLVPRHRFAHLPTPSLMKRYVARADAEQYLRVFQDCEQRRACACGAASINLEIDQQIGTGTTSPPHLSRG